ncbi:MAG: hypothetical protein K9G64_00845 [Bacteroidia bacterium]|nr:hypothetical protein [Bacteroidia bacterium]
MYKIVSIAYGLFYRTYFKFIYLIFILLGLSFYQKSFSQIINIDPNVEKDRSVIANHHYAQKVTVVACDVPTTFNCDPNRANSAIIMDTQPNKEFYFDNFSKYNGGITLNGSTILKLKVAAITPTTTTCQWKLVMIVSNGGSPAPVSEWETLSNYGSSSATSKPSLDLLGVRVSNGCNTPQNSGIWQYFAPADGSPIEIINPATLQPPGASTGCGTETNGVGTYLGVDYNEYTFTIDYRMNPGVSYQPGRYELFIKFCLVEK